jgi:hypothetical protein
MRAETIGRRQDGSRIDGVNSGDRIVARATLLAFLRFRKGFDSLAILNYQFGWLRGLQKLLKGRNFLVAGARSVPNRQILSIPFRSELVHRTASASQNDIRLSP